MFATMLPTVPITEYEASEKVGSEWLELMNVTYDDLTAGNFVDSGETYSCIIWIEDVEIEEAVEAGIDAAEMTREDSSTWSMYDYPYTIEVIGIKVYNPDGELILNTYDQDFITGINLDIEAELGEESYITMTVPVILPEEATENE